VLWEAIADFQIAHAIPTEAEALGRLLEQLLARHQAQGETVNHSLFGIHGEIEPRP
jgi:hypothetical protein